MIEPLFSKGERGPKRVGDRQVLSEIFYILRTGAPWGALLERYGPRTIRQLIADDGALAVILSKSNFREPISHDAGLYKMRNLVEVVCVPGRRRRDLRKRHANGAM